MLSQYNISQVFYIHNGPGRPDKPSDSSGGPKPR